jgi:hypothetical protein
MGTATSQGTRDYVNNPSTPVPQEVRMSWHSGQQSGATEFANPPSHSGRWDAGHMVARQNGGPGNVNEGVFPQNAQINRGNSLHGTPTFDTWRGHEQAMNQSLGSGNDAQMALHLRTQPRVHYGPGSPGWNEPSW